MGLPLRSATLLPTLAVLLLLGNLFLAHTASAATGPYYLYLNESGIGANPSGSYYPAGSVITIQSSTPQGSPWCVRWVGTGSGSFSGTIYPPSTSFNVTLEGPINETAAFVQCRSLQPPLSATIKSSLPPPNSEGQVLLTGNWSGGIPPYNTLLYSGASPLCSSDWNLISSQQSTWQNSFAALIAQNTPTYYCLNITDSAFNKTLLPSLLVNAISTTSLSISLATTTQATTTACSTPYCTAQYTIVTTVFPTSRPSAMQTRLLLSSLAHRFEHGGTDGFHRNPVRRQLPIPDPKCPIRLLQWPVWWQMRNMAL